MTFQAEARNTEGLADTREIRIQGRVTFDEAPELRKAILGEVERTEARRLILELGGVEVRIRPVETLVS